MIVAAVPAAKAEDTELDKANKRADAAEDRAKKAEDALADFKKKDADDKKKAEEDEKAKAEAAKAEFPKKEDDGDDGDEDDADAKAQASLCATVVELTGAKSPAEAEAKIVALVDRAARLPEIEKEQHLARVNAAVASGHLPPARKAWALKSTPAQLASYLEGAPVLPVGQEHSENPEVRAAAEGKVTALTDAEKTTAKALGLTEAQALEAAKLARERNQAR